MDYVFHYDSEGNRIAGPIEGFEELSADGDVVEYDAFESSAEDSPHHGRYGWTGREWNVERELQYNRVGNHRDATIGVWIDDHGNVVPATPEADEPFITG